VNGEDCKSAKERKREKRQLVMDEFASIKGRAYYPTAVKWRDEDRFTNCAAKGIQKATIEVTFKKDKIEAGKLVKENGKTVKIEEVVTIEVPAVIVYTGDIVYMVKDEAGNMYIGTSKLHELDTFTKRFYLKAKSRAVKAMKSVTNHPKAIEELKKFDVCGCLCIVEVKTTNGIVRGIMDVVESPIIDCIKGPSGMGRMIAVLVG
jgi:hypothetical protein